MRIENGELIAETEKELNFSNLINCCLGGLAGSPDNNGKITSTQTNRDNVASKIKESFLGYGYDISLKIIKDNSEHPFDFKIVFNSIKLIEE